MNKTKSIWHWITAFMVLLMMFTCTLTSSGFSVMVNAVKEYAGLTGAESSLIFTIKNLSTLLFVCFADKLYEKIGLRFGIGVGFLMGALAMTIFMFADKSVMMMYIAAFVAGGTYAFAMLLPLALLIHAWFNKMRAFAMAIASAGTGINAMIVTPYLQSVINAQGTAAAFRIEIMMFLVVGTIFVILVRSDPAERGLEPYGGLNYATEAKGKGSSVAVDRKWTKWFILCAGLMGFAAGPTQQYLILHYTDLGYDSMLIAAAYGTLGGVLILFKLSFGALSTKFNFGMLSTAFLTVYVCACLFAIGGAFVISPVFPYGHALCIGVAGAVSSLGYPNWVADTNPENYTKAAKTAQMSYQAVEILGSFVPGIILDITGHYTGAYMLNGLCFASVALIVFTAYRSAMKKAKATAVSAAA